MGSGIQRPARWDLESQTASHSIITQLLPYTMFVFLPELPFVIPPRPQIIAHTPCPQPSTHNTILRHRTQCANNTCMR
jgi:hypothetical protein